MVNWVAIGEVAVGGGVVGVVAISQWMHSGIKICNLFTVDCATIFTICVHFQCFIKINTIPNRHEKS